VNLLVHSLEGDSLVSLSAPGNAPLPEVVPLPADLSVERVVRALEDLQRSDPNRYVRLRSAAALRQISARDLQ